MPTINAIPSRLNVRLHDAEKAAVAVLMAAIAMPHRRAPNVTDAIRAALTIAAGVMQTREGVGAPVAERPL